jgi:hypothetical protein
MHSTREVLQNRGSAVAHGDPPPRELVACDYVSTDWRGDRLVRSIGILAIVTIALTRSTAPPFDEVIARYRSDIMTFDATLAHLDSALARGDGRAPKRISRDAHQHSNTSSC